MTHLISLDNGRTFQTAADAMEEIRARDMWENVVAVMDDGTREAVHADVAPCSDEEFLSEYLTRADADLVIG